MTIIAAPLFSVGQNYATVLAAFSSLKRIGAYLNSTEKQDAPATEVVQSEKVEATKIPVITTLPPSILLRGSFGWSEKPVLENINATILVGRVTMIIGRVGSVSGTCLP